MRERGDTCAHCAGSLGKSPVLWEDGEGKVLRFCCPGCLSVYRVIHGAGLSAFYERREGWVPGPPEESDIPIRAFEKGLIRKGDRSEVTLAVGGIRCASCVWLIERFLSGIKGVISARMNFATQRLTLTFDEKVLSLEEVVESIRSLGYVPRPSRAGTGESVSSRERRDLLIRFGTSAFFTMQLMIVTAALYAGYFRGIEETYRGPFRVVALLLATPVLFYGGYPFLRGTLRSLSARALSMDVLIALGACAAYFYSLAMLFTGGEVYFDTAATIVTLILLGRYLESSARVKAEETLDHLTGLIPDTALRVKEGREEEVPLEEINPGDRIRVRAGERIPLDGTISDGSILVDQSHVTGEPLPLLKEAGDVVLGGSLATDGAATVVVTSPAEESTVSRIISLLERVKGEKSPIQRLADRVVGVFVPAVLALAAGTFFLCRLSGVELPDSLLRAVSVLVVACPCALGIATPLALTLAGSSLARSGILVKAGDALEKGGKVTLLCTDKTGTLTEGTPTVVSVVPAGASREEVIRLAASLEREATHPIATAVAKLGEGMTLPKAEEVRNHPGRGITGVVDGVKVSVGTEEFLSTQGVSVSPEVRKELENLSRKGETVVLVSAGSRVAGLISLRDTLREGAPQAIESLSSLGIRVVLLTGDGKAPAERAAEEAGISEVRWGLTPGGKAEIIEGMREKGIVTAMVGDGINDAVSLAAADVGIAMGSGTDVAIESGDLVLLRPDLSLLPRFFSLARKTRKIIAENLFWAFSYNIIAIPLAAAGKIHPIASAGLMAASSLLVAANSLRVTRP